MIRYYLHLWNEGEIVEDVEGADYHSVEAAIRDAVEAAREIMADRIRNGQETDGSLFEITDAYGAPIATVKFEDAISPRKG